MCPKYTSRKLYNLLRLIVVFEAWRFCLAHGMMEKWNIGMLVSKGISYFFNINTFHVKWTFSNKPLSHFPLRAVGSTSRRPEPIVPWPRPDLFGHSFRALFPEYDSVNNSFQTGRAREGHHSNRTTWRLSTGYERSELSSIFVTSIKTAVRQAHGPKRSPRVGKKHK